MIGLEQDGGRAFIRVLVEDERGILPIDCSEVEVVFDEYQISMTANSGRPRQLSDSDSRQKAHFMADPTPNIHPLSVY